VAAILENINTLVYRSTSVHQFATFFLARLEEDTLRLDFSNAGHNHPVLFRRDGGRELLDRGGVVVGILEDARYEQDGRVLAPGDRLVLYTDGVTEAANPRGELFGEERLYALVDSLPVDLTSEQVTDRILQGVRTHLAGTDAGDDITLMVLRVLEPSPAVAS
jgi:sigma-B regulation protein RsbU (phosphoserine phosphatase)